jgi:hypothetical protein
LLKQNRGVPMRKQEESFRHALDTYQASNFVVTI